MSITFPTIIEITDYRSFQTGNNSPLRDEDIDSAIKTTFVQLNGICNDQIAARWNITDTTDPLYLSSTKKDNIKMAFLLQTKYNLDYDNDTSEGTVQSNWGSNSSSITRPRRDKISQDVLNYLTLAGVYQQFSTQTIRNSALSCIPTSPNWDIRFDGIATKEWAEQSFIPKTTSQTPTDKQILYYDSNRVYQTGNIQSLLPAGDYNQYLHLNSTTGLLEWVTLQGGAGVWGAITGTITDQTDLQEEFSTKQQKVYYGATAPTNPQDNDIWVEESIGSTTVQKQSDWTQTDTTAVDYIKNKPTLSDLVIIQEYKVQDVTLTALESKNINFTPPTVSGYTYVTSLNPTVFGGAVLSQLNRVGTTGYNIWLFNQSDFTQTGEVWLQSLYVRNN